MTKNCTFTSLLFSRRYESKSKFSDTELRANQNTSSIRQMTVLIDSSFTICQAMFAQRPGPISWTDYEHLFVQSLQAVRSIPCSNFRHYLGEVKLINIRCNSVAICKQTYCCIVRFVKRLQSFVVQHDCVLGTKQFYHANKIIQF